MLYRYGNFWKICDQPVVHFGVLDTIQMSWCCQWKSLVHLLSFQCIDIWSSVKSQLKRSAMIGWGINRRFEFLSQQERGRLSTDAVGVAFHISLCGLFVWWWSFQYDNLKKTQHAFTKIWIEASPLNFFKIYFHEEVASFWSFGLYCFQIKSDYCRAP